MKNIFAVSVAVFFGLTIISGNANAIGNLGTCVTMKKAMRVLNMCVVDKAKARNMCKKSNEELTFSCGSECVTVMDCPISR